MNFISIFIIMIIFSSLPFTTSAFWWFNQRKTEAPTVENVTTNKDLTESEKTKALDKEKLWKDSFEQKNIDSVIENRDKFIFTIPELNYIMETESERTKNPSISNATLGNNENGIQVSVNFHKFINGHFSFKTKIVSVENKIHLALSSVSFYGIPIPSKLLETPANKALDDYFSFLYKDQRYTGFSFINQNNSLQLKLEFK